MNKNNSPLQSIISKINFADILTAVSLIIDLMNLKENKQQTSNDQIMEMLEKQNKEYLEKLINQRGN